MPRLLILLTFPPEVTDQYRSRLSRTFPEIAIEVAATADKAVAALADADMLITFGQMMKNLKLDFAAARNLKWVQALGTGLDGITDQPALQPGVTVTSLHGVHGAPVSEAALASMLALSRDLPGFVRAQDEHQWKRWPAKLLQGKTVGILGIGVIAEALAPKCKALGMTVVGITSSPRKVAGFDRVHPVGELLPVLAGVDHFVLLTPYSPATHQMIDAKVFAAMKPTAYLVNLARGGVVDEDALIEALALEENRRRRARRVQPGAAAAGQSAVDLSRTSSSRRIRAASATPIPISPCRSWSTTCAASSTATSRA